MFIVGTVAGSVVVTSILFGLSVVVLVLGAHLPPFSTIPATGHGYASTTGFVLLSGVGLTDMAVRDKAAAMVLISRIIGNVFGVVSEKDAGMLTAKA